MGLLRPVLVAVAAVLPCLAAAGDSAHTVRRAETLSGIARQYRVSVEDLRRWNDLPSDRIAVGQRLTVSQGADRYTVRRGDSLSEIALAHATTVKALRGLNDLKGDRIRPGQKLRLRPARKDEGVHVVQAGESLSQIAGRYHLDLGELRHLNGVDGDLIRPGQRLRLRSTPATVHIVEPGDALWEIARAYNMSVSELRQINALSGSRIYPGQELRLSSSSSQRLGTYAVAPGDNLSEIAQLHQMSVAELRSLNGLAGSVIHPGQTLRVRPLLANQARLEPSQVHWEDLVLEVKGLERISLDNGPYYGQRPKAARQPGPRYAESHPSSPLRTYRQAATLWKGFEQRVGSMGRLSDALEGWHIVLDPGHGGIDPGAIVLTSDGDGNPLYVVEDEYVYDIALRVYVLLRLHGARVDITLLSPNHLIRQTTPPAQTFVHEKNEVFNDLALNRADTRAEWPTGNPPGLRARVRIARQAFQAAPEEHTVFLSFHADIDPNSAEAPLVLYYESRKHRRLDQASRAFARQLLPALGAGARTRGQPLGVLRDNPASVKVLIEVRNLAYVDHAWALRFEQLRLRDAEKIVRGVLDYAGGQRLAGR